MVWLRTETVAIAFRCVGASMRWKITLTKPEIRGMSDCRIPPISERPRERIMKIHGLSLVKNEADVLQETLTRALHWCDHIYVFDNGSSDGTWELVKELAKQHLQIVPYKQDDVLYSNGLLADIFNVFRSKAGPRDWWCRLDADEFYIDDPRIFLTKIPDRRLMHDL
jgi:hypothetical protein